MEMVKHLTWFDWVVVVLLALAVLRVLADAARGIIKTAASVALLGALVGAAWWFWLRL